MVEGRGRYLQAASLQRRQLLPQLVAALLSGQSAAATEQGGAMLGSVHQLAACCGVGSVAEVAGAVAGACSGGRAAAAPPPGAALRASCSAGRFALHGR